MLDFRIDGDVAADLIGARCSHLRAAPSDAAGGAVETVLRRARIHPTAQSFVRMPQLHARSAARHRPTHPRKIVARVRREVAAHHSNHSVRLRNLKDRFGVLANTDVRIGAEQGQRGVGIFIPNSSHAERKPFAQLFLRIGAEDGESFAALVHLIGHPDGHRVELVIHRGHRRPEQNLPVERLKLIVHRTRQRRGLQDTRGLVAVAHQYLDLLAARQSIRARHRVRPGDTTRRELVHHLRQRLTRHKRIGGDVTFFVVASQARQ